MIKKTQLYFSPQKYLASCTPTDRDALLSTVIVTGQPIAVEHADADTLTLVRAASWSKGEEFTLSRQTAEAAGAIFEKEMEFITPNEQAMLDFWGYD